MQLNGGKDKGRNKEQNQCCNQQLPHAWKCDMDVGLNPSPGRLSFWIKVSVQGMKGFSGKILGVMERVWEKMKILFKYGQVEAKLSNPAWDSNQPNVKTSHFLLLFKEMLHSLYPTHTTDTLRKFLENCLEQVTAWQIFFWWLEVSAVLPARLCHVAKHTAVYLPPAGTRVVSRQWLCPAGGTQCTGCSQVHRYSSKHLDFYIQTVDGGTTSKVVLFFISPYLHFEKAGSWWFVPACTNRTLAL